MIDSIINSQYIESEWTNICFNLLVGGFYWKRKYLGIIKIEASCKLKNILFTSKFLHSAPLTSKMSHVILTDTIDHIRDLETYLKHCKDAINDIDEDLELFNDMKDSEIMVLTQQKSTFNRQAETRKLRMNKEIELINNKIKSLKETVRKQNQNFDAENTAMLEVKITDSSRPQGLSVEV